MINQSELINETLQFINRYKRLPYLKEDDIEVEKLDDDNELIIKSYRSLKYINEYFGNYEKYTDYLFDNNILTYELVSKYTKVEPSRLKELLSGKADKVEVSERHSIHIFFNNDFYEKLGTLNERYCKNCTRNKKCGLEYWVAVVQCPKYKEKSNKK